MKKFMVPVWLVLLLALTVTTALASALWMGVNWNDPYGSSAVIEDNILEVSISSCFSTSCWGGAHYNTPGDFRAADTPYVEFTFYDAGPGEPGPQIWIEDETYGGCYGLGLGTCGAWMQFGAWQRNAPEYKNYRIYWWDYDTAGTGWVDTGVARKKGEHTLKIGMRADGTVDYWVDGSLVYSTTDVTPNYFGDVYLAGHAGVYPVKVTGGGQASAGGADFSVTVSAKRDRAGVATGQMEYSRVGQSVADLSLHGTVECLGVFNDGSVAVAAGPAREQNDPAGLIGEGAWMVVEILEGGVGSGDRVRVRLMSEDAGRAVCSAYSGSFPGTIYDGNFNIRAESTASTIEYINYSTGVDYTP